MKQIYICLESMEKEILKEKRKKGFSIRRVKPHFYFVFAKAGNPTYEEFQTLILEILLLNTKQLDKYILLYIILNYVGI